MDDYTHFKCDSCDKIRPVKQRHLVKVAFSIFGVRAEKELRFNTFCAQLCSGCVKESNDNASAVRA